MFIEDRQQIEDILEKLKTLEVAYKKTNTEYIIGDRQVPRVTEVLSMMLNDEWIANWANGLGWKRVSYKAFMQEAADKGTYAHLAVERYLNSNDPDIENMGIVMESIKTAVYSAFDGFLQWWNDIHRLYKDIEVIFSEERLIHEYFAGTCDCLLKVDSKYWLIDFKTSTHMSYKYALQLSAYKFLLKKLKNIDVDKVMILRLDKDCHNYGTYEYDMDNEEHRKLIDDCLEEFMLLSAAYKGRLYTEEEFNNLKWGN